MSVQCVKSQIKTIKELLIFQPSQIILGKVFCIMHNIFLKDRRCNLIWKLFLLKEEEEDENEQRKNKNRKSQLCIMYHFK